MIGLPGEIRALGMAGGANTGPWNVEWASEVGCTASGNTLTKTAVSGWGNAGAISTRALASGNGYMEAKLYIGSPLWAAFGLGKTDSSQDYADIEWAALTNGGNLYAFKAGSLAATIGGYTAGDMVRIAVEGTAVKMYKAGSLVYTFSGSPSYPLTVDTAINTNGQRVDSAVIGGGAWS